MKDGGGHAFFPRPISDNPETLVSTTHTFNVGPVCGFWYVCYNFVPLECRHTYHQFCLSEHSKKERTCLVDSCKRPFLLESIPAIGIRPANPSTSELPSNSEVPSSLEQPSTSVHIDAFSMKDSIAAVDGSPLSGEFLNFPQLCIDFK
jgi:hypothetical protein